MWVLSGVRHHLCWAPSWTLALADQVLRPAIWQHIKGHIAPKSSTLPPYSEPLQGGHCPLGLTG